MMKILVLLSAYNGDLFLNEQLDSILAQKNMDVHLLVRDDGSTDSTCNILTGYKTRYPDRITVIKGENIGWRDSFMALAKFAHTNFNNFEYFAFSDQDDIWLQDKLERGVKMLESDAEINGADSSVPALYFSNQFFYRECRNEGKVHPNDFRVTLKGSLIRNYATGCTIIFNRSLLDLFVKGYPSVKMAHDYWAYILAGLCGRVVADNEAYILYRQHANNQIGGKPSAADVWRRRLQSVSALLGNRNRETMAKDLLRMHGDAMSEAGKSAVEKIAGYRNNIGSRIKLLFDNEYTFNSLSNDFWLKLRILTGRL